MRFLISFLAFAATAWAQGFAPDSVANMIYNRRPNSPTGSAASSAGLFTSTGLNYAFSPTGAPLSWGGASYTYAKTSPNTATIVESDGIETTTIQITFTSSLSGTFRQSIPNTKAEITGQISFSAIPGTTADPQPASPLVNISNRLPLGTGQTATVGFVVGGKAARRVLLRAIGPTLAGFGVANPMQNPSIAVFVDSLEIAANDDWDSLPATSAIFAKVGAFALPANSRDAVVVSYFPPGTYTAQVKGGGPGEVLLEIYFVD